MATAVSYTGCDHGAMFFLRSLSMSLISHPARPLLGLAVIAALLAHLLLEKPLRALFVKILPKRRYQQIPS